MTVIVNLMARGFEDGVGKRTKEERREGAKSAHFFFVILTGWCDGILRCP